MEEVDIFDQDMLDLLNEASTTTPAPVVATVTAEGSPITKKKRVRVLKTPKAPKKIPYPSQCEMYEQAPGDYVWADPYYSPAAVAETLKQRIEPKCIATDVVCPVCEESFPGWTMQASGACLNCSVQIYSHVHKLKCLPNEVLDYFIDKYLKRV